MDEPTLINNFENVYVEPIEQMPPYLIDYNVILDYQVYRSTFDDSIYAIFDHDNELYYVLKDVGSDDVDADLEVNIIARINTEN